MGVKQLVRGVSVAMVSFGLVLGAAAQASANDQSWRLTNASGTVVGTASFDDAANRVYVNDPYLNDRNVRLDVWREGNKGGTHVRCRDDVAGDGRVSCALIWVEDTNLRGELCEMSGSTPTRCTPVKEFWS
ncbi:hypothetical protein [Antribacter gilvus]|uniref:hypothetical protein n=1 Tax=Antribacter gilvus TaxID=2304675 RepID=UPI000F7845AD|nr:hypothetical protein [Antribacter gilvus]